MGIESFGQIAQKFAKNPLGIIALFIVLVYGIAGLVFSSASQHLQPAERSPLIWFLVSFPVVVLFSFLWLVARHHTKLYAPEDFKSEESFFRAMSPSEQRERIKEELREIEQEVDKTANHTELKATPSTLFLAEDLVIREIESEFGVKVHRGVAMGYALAGGEADELGFDGTFKSGNLNYAVEVKYSPHKDFGVRLDPLIQQLRSLIQKFDNFLSTGNFSPFTFIVALVAESWTENKKTMIKQELSKVSTSSKLNLDFRFYDLNELKNKYGPLS